MIAEELWLDFLKFPKSSVVASSSLYCWSSTIWILLRDIACILGSVDQQLRRPVRTEYEDLLLISNNDVDNNTVQDGSQLWGSV